MKVFISHASADGWVAGQVAKELRSRGVEVFLDLLDVESGDHFEDRIRGGLVDCDEFVVLLSPAAVLRPYVWMEIGAAWVRGVRIVGFLHGLTMSELLEGEGTPALLKGINLRGINELDVYLDELTNRMSDA